MSQRVVRSNVLLPLIADSYREEYTEYKRRNLRFSDAGAATQDGEKCEREIVYDLLDTDRSDRGEPELKTHLTSGSLAFFSAGRIHEQEIRRRLRLVLRSPEKEAALFVNGPGSEILAKGKIDNTVYANSIRALAKDQKIAWPADVTLDQAFAEDPLLELKSVNQFQYDEMARSGLLLQTYYDQVQLYLRYTKRPITFVLVENRNGFGFEKGELPFLEFIVFQDLTRQQQLVDGLVLTRKAYEESRTVGRNIVPRPFERTSSKCQYCRFKRECWGPERAVEETCQPDPAVEAPSQELLESALRLYADNEARVKELDAQTSEAKAVLERFFKSTGQKELIVNAVKVIAVRSSRTFLDDAVLREKLGTALYNRVSRPIRAELEKAIKNRELDAKVVEDATKAILSTELSLRLYSIKPATERIAVLADPTTAASPAVAPKESDAWRSGSKSTMVSASTSTKRPRSGSSKPQPLPPADRSGSSTSISRRSAKKIVSPPIPSTAAKTPKSSSRKRSASKAATKRAPG